MFKCEEHLFFAILIKIVEISLLIMFIQQCLCNDVNSIDEKIYSTSLG